MSIHVSKRLLQSSVAAASLVLGLSSVLAAEPPAPFGIFQPATIKHLPAGREDLTFRGEAARRSFSVFLSRAELDQTTTFQLGFKNTAALLPERSSLKLIVNGHPLAAVPIQSPNALSTISLSIPNGTLVAGLNRVEIQATMAHRVDCSVAATYELWTSIDPAQTGFLVPGSAGAIRSVEDVAGEALAVDGTAHIYLHASVDPKTLSQAGRFIAALVRRTGLARPVIEAGAGQGSGPGFDVVLRTGEDADYPVEGLREVGREDGVVFARDPGTGRLTLVVSGLDEADLDAQVTAFATKAATAKAPSDPVSIDGETQVSFADLGLPSSNFTGRHYTAALDISLPSDFYAANYDKARLVLDGAYAGDLGPDSGLVFRVNGTQVSSLSLGAERGGVLQDEPVELPLRFFHPGHNEVAIEGVMTTPADQQCAAAITPAPVRFSLSGTSRLDFPAFVHLGISPQIPGVLARSRQAQEPLHVYLPQADVSSIASGLTAVANLFAGRQGGLNPVIHFAEPTAADVPGLVVAPWASLPAMVSDPLRRRLTSGVTEEVTRSDNGGKAAALPVNVSSSAEATPLDASLFQTSWNARTVLDKAGRLLTRPEFVSARALLSGARDLLQKHGYIFGTNGADHMVAFTPRTLLVAAVDPRLQDERLAGFDMPRLLNNPAEWLVITASDASVLRSGLERMTSEGHWPDLQGDVVAIEADKGTISSAQPSHVAYLRPQRLTLSEIRPILGGLVSNNLELSLAVLALLMTVLGVSTHAVVRRTGVR